MLLVHIRIMELGVVGLKIQIIILITHFFLKPRKGKFDKIVSDGECTQDRVGERVRQNGLK